MRSTKASAAIKRLNERDTSYRYSMVITGSGLFQLMRAAPGAVAEKISDALPLDEFVDFVNGLGPRKQARISKHDAAFEKQLAKRKEK